MAQCFDEFFVAMADCAKKETQAEMIACGLDAEVALAACVAGEIRPGGGNAESRAEFGELVAMNAKKFWRKAHPRRKRDR